LERKIIVIRLIFFCPVQFTAEKGQFTPKFESQYFQPNSQTMKLFQSSLLILLSLFTSACNSSDTKPPTPVVEAPAAPTVGDDKDEHGCKASAGFTWSALKNECIRLFESGIRLDPQEGVADKTVSAFLVFKSEEDDEKGEVFMPGERTPRMFVKQANNKEGDAGTWKSGSFTLRYWRGMYMLEDATEKVLYQGMWDSK
jgi:hypothetical protein